MATFDPKNPPGGSASSSDGVAAGDYLLVLKSFKRNTGKQSGKPYLRAVFQVIHGPAAGKTFFDSVSLDMDNSGAMFRLSMLAEQCGSGAFDLDDDAAVRDALCRKPFKARVTREVNGQYTNNGISRYLNKEITGFERRIIDTWIVDDAERGQFGGGGGGGGGDGFGFDGDGLPDGPPPPSDDDIPF